MKITLREVNEKELLFHTLKTMKELEVISFSDSNLKDFVRKNFLAYNYAYTAYLIWYYLRNNITYQDDQYDEDITAPYIFINTKKGDCDDYSLFTHTALNILGYNPKYVLMGKERKMYTHIAVFCNGILIDGCQPYFNWKNPKYNYMEFI